VNFLLYPCLGTFRWLAPRVGSVVGHETLRLRAPSPSSQAMEILRPNPRPSSYIQFDKLSAVCVATSSFWSCTSHAKLHNCKQLLIQACRDRYSEFHDPCRPHLPSSSQDYSNYHPRACAFLLPTDVYRRLSLQPIRIDNHRLSLHNGHIWFCR